MKKVYYCGQFKAIFCLLFYIDLSIGLFIIWNEKNQITSNYLFTILQIELDNTMVMNIKYLTFDDNI